MWQPQLVPPPATPAAAPTRRVPPARHDHISSGFDPALVEAFTPVVNLYGSVDAAIAAGVTFPPGVADALRTSVSSQAPIINVAPHSPPMTALRGPVHGIDRLAAAAAAAAAASDSEDATFEKICGLISPELRQSCSFAFEDYVRRAIAVFTAPGFGSGTTEMVAGGYTQSGKTQFKSILIVVAGYFKCPVLIITKGEHERNSLCSKIGRALEGSRGACLVLSIPQRSNRADDQRLLDVLVNGGAIVMNSSSHTQMNKARDLVCMARGAYGRCEFALITDEADEMYRTAGADLKLEKAYIALSGDDRRGVASEDGAPGTPRFGPVLHVRLSATLVPVFYALKERNVDWRNYFFTVPEAEYHPLDAVVPLKNDTGEPIFLMHNELNATNTYTNDAVFRLYADAADSPRSLLLDISSPRVTAPSNITVKAELALSYWPHVVAVTIAAAGVAYRLPGCTSWYKVDKEVPDTGGRPRVPPMADILGRIDGLVGLDTPVFVFGYTKMQRGESFRSDFRVPTHLLLAIGKTLSLDKLVQAWGRVTFNGRELLEENGFGQVTILIPHDDYDVGRAYYTFMEEIRVRLVEHRLPLAECLDAIAPQYPHSCNFKHGTRRGVGNKRMRIDVQAIPMVSVPAGARLGQQFYDRVLEHDPVQKQVLEAARQCDADARSLPLAGGAGHASFDQRQVAEAYEKLHGSRPDSKVLAKELGKLAANGMLYRKRDESIAGVTRRRAPWVYQLRRG